MLQRRAIQGLAKLSAQVEIPPTRHGSVKTIRNRLPYPVAGCFIFPRLYLTSVRFLRIMRNDPTREDGYWRMWETRYHLSTSLVHEHMVFRGTAQCLLQSISFSLFLCDYNSPKPSHAVVRPGSSSLVPSAHP